MERFAHNVVKKHMGKTREDGVGNRQATGNALEKKYNSNTKEAGRAYQEYFHNAKMKSGDDPDGFLYTMDGQYPTSGTKTSFFWPFLPSTRGSVQLATRGGIFTWQIFGA